jgi:hypothetical protein
MAGDWIKMRVELWDHPKIVRLASALKADRTAVVGALFRTWALADQYSTDGYIDGYSGEVLDAAVGIGGWAASLAQVGWLVVGPDGISIPRFEEHNGQSAKRRAQDADRKRAVRKMSASEADGERTECGPEKRREDGSVRPFVATEHADEWPEARRLAREAARKLWPSRQKPLAERDRDELLKFAFLSRARFSEDFLADAIAATLKQGKNKPAYLRGVVKKKVAAYGYDLNQLLDSIDIPPKPQTAGSNGDPQ